MKKIKALFFCCLSVEALIMRNLTSPKPVSHPPPIHPAKMVRMRKDR